MDFCHACDHPILEQDSFRIVVKRGKRYYFHSNQGKRCYTQRWFKYFNWNPNSAIVMDLFGAYYCEPIKKKE